MSIGSYAALVSPFSHVPHQVFWEEGIIQYIIVSYFDISYYHILCYISMMVDFPVAHHDEVLCSPWDCDVATKTKTCVAVLLLDPTLHSKLV